MYVSKRVIHLKQILYPHCYNRSLPILTRSIILYALNNVILTQTRQIQNKQLRRHTVYEVA